MSPLLQRGLIVGSYATAPSLYPLEHPEDPPPFSTYNAAREAAFYSGLARLQLCGGLEVQLDRDGRMHSFDEAAFLSRFAKKEWVAVITCIGGTMARIGADPKFGLASKDKAGRMAAIEFARQALAAVKRWNGRSPGCGRCVAVELHSGPNQTHHGAASSKEAFEKSLFEISSWDWDGARLFIEHCDSPGKFPASKGFLTLETELVAITRVNMKSKEQIGLTLNWARSVLETRNVATPLEHIEKVRVSGVPLGLMFSGVHPEEGPYGPWRDTHVPHAPSVEGSLLTTDRITEAVRLAGDGLAYCGGKITSLATGLWIGNMEDDVDVRVGLNASLLHIIKDAQKKSNTVPEKYYDSC
jgi:hypothetical protein